MKGDSSSVGSGLFRPAGAGDLFGWGHYKDSAPDGAADAEIVAGAWDFERINRRHARHLKVLAEHPGGALRNDAAAKALLRWAAAEREARLDAVTNDPLLPGRILPSDYLGQPAWRRRVEVLRDASRQLRTFNRA